MTYVLYAWYQDCAYTYSVGIVDEWVSDVTEYGYCDNPYSIIVGSYEVCPDLSGGSFFRSIYSTILIRGLYRYL